MLLLAKYEKKSWGFKSDRLLVKTDHQRYGTLASELKIKAD
jgi:hypothetical protein